MNEIKMRMAEEGIPESAYEIIETRYQHYLQCQSSTPLGDAIREYLATATP